MKKILTASLVAMMAVTAARAEIASTQYVTSKVTSAQNTLQGSINTVAGDLAAEVTRATGIEGGLDTRIQALETKTGDNGATTQAIAAAQAAANNAQGEVDTLEGVVADMDAAYQFADTTLQGNIDTVSGALTTEVNRAKAAEQANTDAIAALKNTEVKANADAIAALKNTEVKANADAIAAEVSRATGIEGGLDTRIQALETKTGDNGATTQAIAAAQAAANKAQDEVDTLEGVVAGKQTQSSELSLGSTAGAWQTLASINGYSTNCGTGKTCALSNVDGNISWVAVVNE